MPPQRVNTDFLHLGQAILKLHMLPTRAQLNIGTITATGNETPSFINDKGINQAAIGIDSNVRRTKVQPFEYTESGTFGFIDLF